MLSANWRPDQSDEIFKTLIPPARINQPAGSTGSAQSTRKLRGKPAQSGEPVQPVLLETGWLARENWGG
jgi:hypothetical protein